MKKLATLLALVAIAGLMLITAPQNAQARPQYTKVAAAKYPAAKEALKEAKCGACHGGEPLGKDKKVLSDYGEALKDALDTKNEKDKEKIDVALDAAGKEDAGDGKTYADLLSAGELPAPATE